MTLLNGLLLALVNVLYRGLPGASLGLFAAEVVASLIALVRYGQSKHDLLRILVEAGFDMAPYGIAIGFALGVLLATAVIAWHAFAELRASRKTKWAEKWTCFIPKTTLHVLFLIIRF